MTYHSALKKIKDLPITKELHHYQKNGNLVFTHNLLNGYNDKFVTAKTIYSEPSWKQGFQTFMNKTKNKGDYKEYLQNIKMIIQKLNIPTYLIIGKHMKTTLQPQKTMPIKLHNYPSLLATWNTTNNIPKTLENNQQIINYITQNHNHILDFNAGYGNLAKHCKKNNKKFICSDINPHCIYYIAKKYMEMKT